jgi:hypothetical protein
MGESSHSDDLALLHATFPDWQFQATWTVAGTGPDARYLQARKDDVTLTAWSAPDLAAQVVAAVLTAALRQEDGQ